MKLVLFFTLALLSGNSFASDETRAAVKNVQEQMKKPSFHQDAAKESEEAANVEKMVKELSGNSQNEQEIYNLAADVLGNMQDMTPEQMMSLLQAAQSNPAGFAEKWTPEQKKKLKELAEKLPASHKRNP